MPGQSHCDYFSPFCAGFGIGEPNPAFSARPRVKSVHPLRIVFIHYVNDVVKAEGTMRNLYGMAISGLWVGFLTLGTTMSLQAADAAPDASGLAKQAKYEFDSGNYKKAAKLYKEAVTLQPGDSKLHDHLGRVYERMAETSALPVFLTNKARASFHRSMELDPENQQAIRDMLDLTLRPTGACYGDLGEAAFLTERLSHLNPQDGFYARAELEEALRDQRSPEMKVRCAYTSVRAFSKSRHTREKNTEPLIAKNDIR